MSLAVYSLLSFRLPDDSTNGFQPFGVLHAHPARRFAGHNALHSKNPSASLNQPHNRLVLCGVYPLLLGQTPHNVGEGVVTPCGISEVPP